MYCRFCSLYCQIYMQNSKLQCSHAPGSGTFSWCGVTPDNYLFLTMNIGHQDPIGHRPSPQQPRALNSSQKASLSDLSPFTSAILWSRSKKDQFWQQVVFAKTGRPPLLGHGEEISIVVSCSYYSSYSYFSPPVPPSYSWHLASFRSNLQLITCLWWTISYPVCRIPMTFCRISFQL